MVITYDIFNLIPVINVVRTKEESTSIEWPIHRKLT